MHKPSPRLSRSLVVLVLACFALALSAFTITGVAEMRPDLSPLRLENAIQNGDFELFRGDSDVAEFWQPYSNGQAHFGWYEERWEEAVHSGERSQLMEIFLVEGYVRNRTMAIYQTANVTPNANYFLTIHALMRSDAPEDLRNQGDYAMHWGIDYSGTGSYGNVQNWITMTLTEQPRRGSATLDPAEAEGLTFERITATVTTGNSNRITLFIRGMKFEPTGTEVNFNVDDVSLIGPYPIIQPTATPTVPLILPVLPVLTPTVPPSTSAIPTPDISTVPPSTPPIPTPGLPVTGGDVLPDAGTVLPKDFSTAALLLAGLVFVFLGAKAVGDLLR